MFTVLGNPVKIRSCPATVTDVKSRDNKPLFRLRNGKASLASEARRPAVNELINLRGKGMIKRVARHISFIHFISLHRSNISLRQNFLILGS